MKKEKSVEKTEAIEKFKLQNLELACQSYSEIYFETPLMKYFFPHPQTRRKKIESLFRYQMLCRMDSLYQTKGSFIGLCILESSKSAVTLKQLAKEFVFGLSMLKDVGLVSLGRMIRFQIFSQSLRARHAPAPHAYLDLFAVQPKFQRQGFGRQILADLFSNVLEDGTGIYLETLGEKETGYYKEFGFHVVAEYRVPGTDIPYYCMFMEAELALVNIPAKKKESWRSKLPSFIFWMDTPAYA